MKELTAQERHAFHQAMIGLEHPENMFEGRVHEGKWLYFDPKASMLEGVWRTALELTAPLNSTSLLEFYMIVHDQSLQLGDRLQRIASRIACEGTAEHRKMRQEESAEAARLQTYLMENHNDVRPDYPIGLFGWALGALLDDYKHFHPDDTAVNVFAKAMRKKMATSRAKGRGGWDDPEQCSVQDLARMLVEHVSKGDPIDIGNFAMMLHTRNATPWDIIVAMEGRPRKETASATDADDLSEAQWREKCWESIRQHHMLPEGVEQRIKASILTPAQATPEGGQDEAGFEEWYAFGGGKRLERNFTQEVAAAAHEAWKAGRAALATIAAGHFVMKGDSWVQTHKDDPQAVILYHAKGWPSK